LGAQEAPSAVARRDDLEPSAAPAPSGFPSGSPTRLKGGLHLNRQHCIGWWLGDIARSYGCVRDSYLDGLPFVGHRRGSTPIDPMQRRTLTPVNVGPRNGGQRRYPQRALPTNRRQLAAVQSRSRLRRKKPAHL